MRKTFTLMTLLSIYLPSIAQHQNEQTRIQAAIVRFFDGIANVDDEAIKAEVSNDFILLEDGSIWNVDSLINALSPLKTLNFKRVNKINFLKTEQKADVAWVSYNNLAEININGKQRNVRWLESAVLVREGRLWKIKLLHSTKIKP